MLARGELRCIGATTVDEYRKYIEKDAALDDGGGRSWLIMDSDGLMWIDMD